MNHAARFLASLGPRVRARSAALAAALTLGAVLGASAPAFAAPAADDGFKPVPAGQAAAPEATLSAPMLVEVAYSAIWIAVTIYLVGLWRRSQRLAGEMEELRRRLDGHARASGKASP
jgi:hypothetical protein